MKCNSSECLRILLLLVLTLGIRVGAFACDLTQTTLISLNTSGANPILTIQLCVGYGRTAGVNGADGSTQDILFGFFDSNNPIDILAFTPAAIGSPAPRNCSMDGFETGELPFAPFNAANAVLYSFDPSSPGCSFGSEQAFTCVTSTSSCGGRGNFCTTFSFTLDAVPDSMRVFGVEGAGNPTAGCYPNPDMAVYLTALPVTWGRLSGTTTQMGNALSWNTLREANNSHFDILRAADGQNFEKLDVVASKGNTESGHTYDFLDRHPLQGPAHYKLRQIDIEGNSSESDVVLLSYTGSTRLQWVNVGPVPAKDAVRLDFLADQSRDLVLTLVNVEGKVVQQRPVKALFGSNSLSLPLDGLAPGMYFLRLQGQDTRLDYKLMKL
jgi:hypothetical protein